MESLFILFAALFGAVVGSFLNVVILRLPEEGASIVFPASHCPKCGYTLRWFDNIPILSWLALRGRCRKCRKPISLQYPAVEFAMALLAALLMRQFGPGFEVFDAATTGRAGRFVEKYVPAGAKDFRCKGHAGWGGRVRFSCEVGESESLAHAAANGVELRRNDPSFNANPATASDPFCAGARNVADLAGGEVPERYWFHGWVFPNLGGWFLVYDIDRGVLHGSYSAN